MSDPQLLAALDLMRRMPPSQCETWLESECDPAQETSLSPSPPSLSLSPPPLPPFSLHSSLPRFPPLPPYHPQPTLPPYVSPSPPPFSLPHALRPPELPFSFLSFSSHSSPLSFNTPSFHRTLPLPADLVDLVPHLTEDLLNSIDQPLQIGKDAQGNSYLLCDYNRDGDSYRCARCPGKA